jgi:hypothetical protein
MPQDVLLLRVRLCRMVHRVLGMTYIEPTTVLAPRASVRFVQILHSTGDGGWSIARVGWEGSERLGVRWNGAADGPGIGNPQSRGNATWFILPEELESAVLDRLDELTMSGPGGLLERYREMAADTRHEAEAEEWSEGLIGDASAER